MKFVATAPDVPAVAVGLIKYKRLRDVNCPNCQRTFYLWTSIFRPKPSEIDEAVRRLTKINTIPNGYAFTLAAQDPNACGWNGTVGADPYLLPNYVAAGYSY